jgi:hypothetical protein
MTRVAFSCPPHSQPMPLTCWRAGEGKGEWEVKVSQVKGTGLLG